MKIVLLADNLIEGDKLFADKGVCFYVSFNDKNILFGLGASGVFLANAERLSVPIASVDTVIFPHNRAHVTGGAEALLKTGLRPRFFISRDSATECYEKNGLFSSRSGLPSSFFLSDKYDVVAYSSFSEVCENFYLTTCENPDSEKAMQDKKLFIKYDGRQVRDDFKGESFAVIFPGARRQGCVVLTACAHIGITNILATVKKMWDCPIIAVVGCFALTSQGSEKPLLSSDEIRNLAEEISDFDTGRLYTCHCTGKKGFEALSEHLGTQIQLLRAGDELEF